MCPADMKVNLYLKAFDTMSGVVKSACAQSDEAFEKTNKHLEDTANKFDKAGQKAAVFGGALVAVSGLNAKIAGDFEAGMNNVSTLIDTETESLKAMGAEVLKIGKNSPKAISDLTDGLYSIRSAGISADEQFKVLAGSEKLSVAGLSTTAEAVDIATSAINAFNLKGKEADGIYDMFFKVVKYGKTNISEFAQGFGSVAGVVAAAGIQLDEYSASVAAMTTSGLKANIAHTQMKAAIAGLSRGSKEQMAIFKNLGAKNFPDLIKKSGGVVNAFDKIYKGVNGNQSKLIQLVGSVEGYNAILSLTGANNKTYLQTLNDMRNGGDSLYEAYRKQTEGLNNQMAIMKNNAEALSIKFGTGLLPVIKAAGGTFQTVSGIIDKMPPGLTSFVSIAAAGIGVVSLFGGTALMAVGGIIRNVILLRKVMRGFSIAAWANPALLPIIGVTAGIVALGVAGVYCYKKFEGFRNVCQGTWAVVKAGGAWLAVLWQGFLTGTSTVWNFIKPAALFAAKILGWITPIGLAVKAIQALWSWIGKLINKAGGLRGIGGKLKEWGDKQSEKAAEINKGIKADRGVDGSHANGLDYVPFDGYVAELHKGETVLTAPEANRWRTGQSINNSSSETIKIDFHPSINWSSNVSNTSKQEFLTLLYQFKEELVKIILEVLKRREARAY